MNHIKKFTDKVNESKEVNEEYLNKVKEALLNFEKSYETLTKLWSEDKSNGIDLNDVIAHDYPFNLSFDELDIPLWVKKSIKKINKLK